MLQCENAASGRACRAHISRSSESACRRTWTAGQITGLDATMNTTYANHYRALGGATTGTGSTHGDSSLFGRIVHWFTEQRRYHRTLNELSALTDRELDDIGLNRGDIEWVARRCTR